MATVIASIVRPSPGTADQPWLGAPRARARLPSSELQVAQKEIDERNEVEQQHGVEDDQICLLDRRAPAEHRNEEKRRGDSRLYQDRDVWRAESWMNPSEPFREVPIQTDHERDSRRAAQPGPNCLQDCQSRPKWPRGVRAIPQHRPPEWPAAGPRRCSRRGQERDTAPQRCRGYRLRAIRGAAMRTARGSVREGSRVSPAYTAANSRPAKAKATEAQRLSSVRLLMSGTRAAREKSFAGGRVATATAPSTTRMIPGTYEPTAPTFWSHLPVPNPTMLSPATSQSAPRVTLMTYHHSLPNPLEPFPNA